MDLPEPQEETAGSSSWGEANQSGSFTILVLRELFLLLEKHAPRWYTEDHRRQAVEALMNAAPITESDIADLDQLPLDS